MTVYQRAVLGQVWVDHTPTLAGFAIGNGTISSRFFRAGKLVCVEDHITFGSTSTFGAAPTLTLPSAVASGHSSLTWMDGTAQTSLNSTMAIIKWRWNGTATVGHTVTASGTYAAIGTMSSTAPITFAAGSVLTRYGFYEEA